MTHELICPVSTKTPISREDGGDEPIMRWGAFNLEPNFNNKVNKELCECGAKQSSVSMELREQDQFSGVETHRPVPLLMSGSVQTCRATRKQQKTDVPTHLGARTGALRLGGPSGLRPPDT